MRPLDQPRNGTGVVPNVGDDVTPGPPWQQRGAVELCVGQLVEFPGEEGGTAAGLEQLRLQRYICRQIVAGNHQPTVMCSVTTRLLSWPSPSIRVTNS